MGDADKQQNSSSRQREAYFLEYAADIRKVCSVPLAVTGGFRNRSTMVEALESGALDVIGLGRPLCTQPNIKALLSGELSSLEPWEDQLQLGPGYLGPNSNNQTIRTLNFAAATQWYYRQIIQLAEGKAPITTTGIAGVMMRHMIQERRIARSRHFAKG
jgi:tRNA-dihydrouridine synthase